MPSYSQKKHILNLFLEINPGLFLILYCTYCAHTFYIFLSKAIVRSHIFFLKTHTGIFYVHELKNSCLYYIIINILDPINLFLITNSEQIKCTHATSVLHPEEFN